MKITSLAKSAVCAAVLGGAAVGASAATYDLGAIAIGTPKTFNGSVIQPAGAFTDTFTFTLPTNGGSGYSVIDFPLSLPGFGDFKTLFDSITLYSAGANGAPGGGDDVLLKTTSGAGTGQLSMTFGPTTSGAYFLDVFGRTDGSAGGLFSGSISVSPVPVPEPESYAMLLAGLGVMGAIAIRRNKKKSD